ncbi:MAG: response regulator [Pirellulales bacterium]|nr:response regulator [Pirellulales bacterium]
MSEQPTVFLVDDDESARKSLTFLIESIGLDVATFDSAVEYLETYDPEKPGCLVLDVRMPRMSGLELQQKLADSGIRIPIIFVSGHADIGMASRAFRAGAFDFVEKPFNNQELLERIQQAIDRDAEWRKEARHDDEVQARLDRLTPREKEVLELILAGKSIKQLAFHFEISIQTAAKHRSRILDKMRVQNDVELVRMVNADSAATGE